MHVVSKMEEQQIVAYPMTRARSYVKSLSVEILLHILRYMSARELCIVAAVCISFRECALDKSLWRSVSLHSSMDKTKLVGAINMMTKLNLFNNIRILSINNDNINPTMVEQIIQSTPNLREIKFSNVKVTEKMAKLLVSGCPALEQVYMEGGRTDDVSIKLISCLFVCLYSIILFNSVFTLVGDFFQYIVSFFVCLLVFPPLALFLMPF